MKKTDHSDTHKKYPFHYPHHPIIRGYVNDVHDKSISFGIYLLRIEAGEFKDTKKIFVSK